MEWDFADPLARITGAFIGNKHFTVRAYRQSSNPWHTDIPEVHFGAHNLGLGPLCVVQHPHGTERERFSDCSVVVWDSFASLDALQRQSHNAATLAYDLPQIGPKLAPAVARLVRTPGVAVAARRVFSHVAGVGAERVDHYDDCHLLVAPLGIGGISAEQLQQLFADIHDTLGVRFVGEGPALPAPAVEAEAAVDVGVEADDLWP